MMLKHVMIQKDNKCLICGKGPKNKLHLESQKNKTRKILDLGCGPDKYKTEAFFPDATVIGIDFVKREGVDYTCDFEKDKLPFQQNTFDMVVCWHIIEHLSDTVRIMEELHRVAKPDGIIFIRVPHFRSMGIWQDITHKKGFSFYTFDSLKSYTDKQFEIADRRLLYFHLNSRRRHRYFLAEGIGRLIERLANWNPWFYEDVLCNYLPGVVELMVKVKVKKPALKKD